MSEFQLRRLHRAIAIAATLIATAAASPASAQWHTMQQPGGYGVARFETAGPILGVALTCEGTVPILAIRPQRQPARSPASLLLIDANGRERRVVLARNGATEVWFAAIRDKAVIDAFAAGPVRATMGEPPVAVAPDGADGAFRTALAGCYAAPARTPVPIAAGPGALSATDTAGITRAVRSYYIEDDGLVGSTTTRTYAAITERCGALQGPIEAKFGDGEAFGMCGEDASPICECQDLDGAAIADTLKVEIRPVSPGIVTAIARFDLFRGETAKVRAPREIFYRVMRTADGWQVDDIVDEDGAASDRDSILAAIKDMEKRLKIAAWTPPATEILVVD